ncbi:MAG: tRNA lysidine(34) synthetase TilS [Bacteroidota bacterium]
MRRSIKQQTGVVKSFLDRLSWFCSRHRLIEPGDKILIAVSGGRDSTVLLDALCHLQNDDRLTLAVVHCNHRLRGRESNRDEVFVRRLAERYKVNYYVERLKTKEYTKREKLSIEEAARDLRYQFFQKVLISCGFEKVATAHTADDNAETLLLHLFRGAGVAGLSGIPMHRKDVNVVRPLLFASRADVDAYARVSKLKHREDSSNRKKSYRRNYIRRALLPAIRKNVNENIVRTLNRTAELFSHLNEYLKTQLHESFTSVVRSSGEHRIDLDISRLRSYLYFVQENVVLLALKSLTPREVNFEKIRSILSLTEAETGSQVDAFGDIVAFKDRDALVLVRVKRQRGFRYEVTINQAYQFPEFEFQSSLVDRNQVTFSADRDIAFIDAGKLGNTLLLRSWKDGDWFIPFGMRGKKKLSDFFVDEKVALYEKYQIPVLEYEGSIVWVCGRRLDDRFKVTEATERVLRLKIAHRRS